MVFVKGIVKGNVDGVGRAITKEYVGPRVFTQLEWSGHLMAMDCCAGIAAFDVDVDERERGFGGLVAGFAGPARFCSLSFLLFSLPLI